MIEKRVAVIVKRVALNEIVVTVSEINVFSVKCEAKLIVLVDNFFGTGKFWAPYTFWGHFGRGHFGRGHFGRDILYPLTLFGTITHQFYYI